MYMSGITEAYRGHLTLELAYTEVIRGISVHPAHMKKGPVVQLKYEQLPRDHGGPSTATRQRFESSG